MKKILVIQNKRIGDVLIASVLANNLKKQFPESEISYFVYDYTTGVLEGNPNIDRIIHIQEKWLKKLPNLLSTAVKIRKERYDIIIDPYAKFQSRFLCWFSKAPIRAGFKRPGKKLKAKFYTHEIEYKKESHLHCGKALEDRMNLLEEVFQMKHPDPKYKIFLTSEEQQNNPLAELKKPIVIFGILGSTPNKSLPFAYTAQLIDYITENYPVSVVFNYAPYQKEAAKKIYDLCQNKTAIHWDVYADSIRGFVQYMYHSDLLIANEGGSVHIAKALDKPTFTIYSPFISKVHWNSFEDGITHDSIHLYDEDPEAWNVLSREEKKEIEKNPEQEYKKLTPEFILKKLQPYLEHHLADFRKAT